MIISVPLISLIFTSCGNKELKQYNKNTQYINEDFNNFIDEYGKIEKEGLSYNDSINNKKYLVVKFENSISLSIDSLSNSETYWIDVHSNGMKESSFEADAYKDPSLRESKDFCDFSKEEQYDIAKEYIKAKLYLMHKAKYKDY